MFAICTILLLGVVFAYLCDLSAIKRNIVIDPNTSLGRGHLRVFVTSTNLFRSVRIYCIYFFCRITIHGESFLVCAFRCITRLAQESASRTTIIATGEQRERRSQKHNRSLRRGLRFVSLCWLPLPLPLWRRRRWLANF